MLTPQEQALIADIRTNAAATGEDDGRTKSDLRRGQRRLLAIIDRLCEPAALVIRKPLSAALLAELKRRPMHIVIEEGAEAVQALEACRLLVKWHSNVFGGGKQALRFDNGYPVDRTDVDEAARLAKEALGVNWKCTSSTQIVAPGHQDIDPEQLLREMLCDDCPAPNQYTNRVRCRECPRRRPSAIEEAAQAESDRINATRRVL